MMEKDKTEEQNVANNEAPNQQVESEAKEGEHVTEAQFSNSAASVEITQQESVVGEQNQQVESEAQEPQGLIDKLRAAMRDPKKRIVLIFLGVIQVGFIFYVMSLFGGSDKNKKIDNDKFRTGTRSYSENYNSGYYNEGAVQVDSEKTPSKEDKEKIIDEDLEISRRPETKLPPIPPAPLEPIVPMAIPEAVIDDTDFSNTIEQHTTETEEDREELASKRSSSSMVFGGGGSASSKAQFLGFDGGVIEGAEELEETGTANVKATKVADAHKSLLQGKVIDGVLETAINTTVGADSTIVRALVSRDVYAEQGKTILIPKGSRIVGSCSSEKKGNTRLVVMWDRIITPSGIDIAISSPSVDPLGRVGVSGIGDDRILNRLLSAFLVSYVVPLSVKKATDKINGQDATNDNGKTTVMYIDKDGNMQEKELDNQMSFHDKLVNDASNKFSEVANDAIDRRLPSEPIISVMQGTHIKILVNKDVIFPDKAIERLRR